MVQMKMALLGSFSVSIEDEPVTQFESDAARMLLAYLALNAGTPFRREYLADFFWPDQSRAEALHALRQTLTRLRRAIRDESYPQPFIDVTRQTIAFDLKANLWLDVRQFSEKIEQTRSHMHKRLERCVPCMNRLREAVKLYRGNFLQGTYYDSQPFDEWVSVQREQSHHQALNAMSLLSNYAEIFGADDEAQQYARRQIELEPWREEAHRQLMRALARQGARSSAIKQYETCCVILDEELGVEPETETQALYQKIRSGEYSSTSAGSALVWQHLPAFFTPFIGRGDERVQIAELLNHPDCRLLTLLGPGGIGKTRLAVQAAAELAAGYRDGVEFVSMAAVASPELLVPAIAQALQFHFSGETSLASQLNGYLRMREMTLVLDGFEHLTDGARILAEMLQMAPELTILVTSRERLNIPGEWVLPVGGLACSKKADSIPDVLPGSGIPEEDAVQLFLACAQRNQNGFKPSLKDLKAIDEICRMVEGMPLAIELAAGWILAYSCAEIAEEIGRSLDFLATDMQGIPDKHRSIRSLFDASWSILSQDEKSVMKRLSIFSGSFDREAARQVAGISPAMLITLVNRSLLRQETIQREGSRQRYEFHDLIRRFTVEKTTDLSVDLHASHSKYYLDLLLSVETELQTNSQPAVLLRLEDEINNIEKAWKWAVHHGSPDLLRAGKVLFTFLDSRCRYQEGVEWFSAPADASLDPEQRAFFMACQGWFVFLLGRQAEGIDRLEKSLAIAEGANLLREKAFVLRTLGAARLKSGAFQEALQYCNESLSIYKAMDDRLNASIVLVSLGHIAYSMGRFPESKNWCLEAISYAEQTGNPFMVEANCLRQLGNIAYSENQYADARDYYERALKYYQASGNLWGESAVTNNLGSVAIRLGQYALGRKCVEQGLAIKEKIGDQWGIALSLGNLGVLADDEGDFEAARAYHLRALALSRELNSRSREGRTLHNLASTLIHLGMFEEAKTYLDEALVIREEINDREGYCRTLDTLSLLNYYLEESQNALSYAEKAMEVARAIGNRALLAYSLLDVSNALLLQNRPDEALEACREALDLRIAMGEGHLACEMKANIARIYFLQNRLAPAQELVNEILAYLEENTLTGTEDPYLVYLVSFRILNALQDARAAEILNRACAELLNQAARIKDRALRETFLRCISSHRELLSLRDGISSR